MGPAKQCVNGAGRFHRNRLDLFNRLFEKIEQLGIGVVLARGQFTRIVSRLLA
jgi:hypothetical protein